MALEHFRGLRPMKFQSMTERSTRKSNLRDSAVAIGERTARTSAVWQTEARCVELTVTFATNLSNV